MGKAAIKEGLGRWTEYWAAKSDSSPEDYIVARDRDGKYGCSCKGWTQHIYCPKCESNVKKGQEYCDVCGCDLIEHKPIRSNCKHIGRVIVGHPSVRSISQAVLERLLR